MGLKEVILSADGDSVVYSVPDAVANNLESYCNTFCNQWMQTSPAAEKYKIGVVYCYNEADFIDYLNTYLFPEQKSVFVKSLGWTDLGRRLPAAYSNHPYFNF